MKTKYRVIHFFIVFLSLVGCVHSQTNPNYLSYDEYAGIEINGVPLSSINSSQGEQNEFLSLFQINFASEELLFPDPYREYSSSDMVISFETNNSGIFEISSLEINSSNIQIKIGDNTFRIGDISNVLQAENINNSGSIIYKISPESDEFLLTNESYIDISFEAGTRKITKVTLVVMT